MASQLVLSIDLAPTLLDMAGLTPGAGLQGRSLVPIFAGAPGNWRGSFLIEYFSDTVFPRVLNMGYSAVRTRNAKYIAYRDLQGMNELYDLEADPYEERNLIDAPESAALGAALQAELDRLLEASSSPAPTTARLP